MSTGLLALVGVIYAGTVCAFLYEGQPWKALIFAGYVIGQIGFILDSRAP